MTCAGLGPALAVSRLSRATRRSHGSLPQHVSRRNADESDHLPQGASERRDCERRDTLQKVKRPRSVTGRRSVVERPFFHGVEPERRVRMRPAAMSFIALETSGCAWSLACEP